LIAFTTQSGLSLREIKASKSWAGVRSPIFSTLTDAFSIRLGGSAVIFSLISSSFEKDLFPPNKRLDFFYSKTF